MKWKLSTFKSLTNTKATTQLGHFHDIRKALLTPWSRLNIKEKKQLPLWSPTVFRNDRRSGANAHALYFLVYDLDDGLTSFDTWRLFHKYLVMAHTSFSHRPQHHKYRIILPLANPIPATEWERASQAALDMWKSMVGRGEPDLGALHDKARAYFRYGIPHPESNIMADHPMFPNNYHQTAWSIGDPLDLKYDHIKIKRMDLLLSGIRPKSVKYNKPRVYSNGKTALSEVMMSSAFRSSMAVQCGGTVQGNQVRYVTCPGCGRKSVYFSIDLTLPSATKWPTCNHLNKCGWWGRFEDLL